METATMKVTWKRPLGFRLAAASEFYSGFVPGSGMAAIATDRLTLAFRLDRTFDPVAVRIEEHGDTVEAKVVGTKDATAVVKQVARILGFEANAEAWQALGDRVPLVKKLKDEFPGFFTAAKSSPYDAAAWSVIAPRTSLKQAAALKIAIARELGDELELDGEKISLFPSPAALAQLEKFPGLSDEKAARLRAVAAAALAGKLDVDRLRSMPEEDALAELLEIRGVGPWAASHIYYRGAAPADAIPTVEPRVLHGYADAAGIEMPSEGEFLVAAEEWRPFRMWVCVLLSRHLARAGKWQMPGLSKERGAASRVLAKRATRKKSA